MTVSSRIATYLVAGAIAAALLFYAFGQLSALLGAHDAGITRASRAQLALHPALVRLREKMRRAQYAQQRAVDSLERVAQRADSADSAHAVAAGRPVPAPSPWRPVAQGCSLVVRSCEARATHAEGEAAELTQRLKDQVTVKDRRCGIFAGVGPGIGWVASTQGTGPGVAATLTVAAGCRLWP